MKRCPRCGEWAGWCRCWQPWQRWLAALLPAGVVVYALWRVATFQR